MGPIKLGKMAGNQRILLLLFFILCIGTLVMAGFLLYLGYLALGSSSANIAVDNTSTQLLTSTSQKTPVLSATPSLPPTQIFSPTPTNIPTPSQTPTAKPLIYFFPVQPIDVASYAHGHHDYPAVDIFAPEGTSFVAVADGIVDFVSYEDHWQPAIDDPSTRGGISIAIIGNDGVRYYGSHLSSIAAGIEPGQQVNAGQVIGYIGNSGNARGIATHLHFGISMPTFPDDWEVRRGEVDPYPYLKAWENNENITPVLPEH
jgi:peptidoglycan LD-endopeptidase LytH